MAKTPTQSDLADFRGFCLAASNSQLREIARKEKAAGRDAYHSVAVQVLRERGLSEEG